MSEPDKPASTVPGEIAHWGQQTICFAMSLRAIDVGKPIDEPERVRAAGVEASRIIQELWESVYNAAAEHHDPVGIQHVTIPFAREVLYWVADHLSDEVAK